MARKYLEAAPRIIFTQFRRPNFFLPFLVVFCRFAVFSSVFCRFSFFRRFRCFSAVFHSFSLFLTVFHSFFYPFSTTFYRFFHFFFMVFCGKGGEGYCAPHVTPQDGSRAFSKLKDYIVRVSYRVGQNRRLISVQILTMGSPGCY